MNAARKRVLAATRREGTYCVGLSRLLLITLLVIGPDNPWVPAGEPVTGERELAQRSAVSEEIAELKTRLRLETTGGRRVVVLTVTNVSGKPVVVDRELIFGVDVRVRDEGSEVLDKYVKDLSTKHWTKELWERRVVTLLPGQSLSRRLDPHAGIARFSYGHSLGPVELPATPTELVFAVDPDELCKKDRGPDWLEVWLGMRWDEDNALARYTGLPGQVRQFGPFSGFRAINLHTGKELSQVRYEVVWDEDERRAQDAEDGVESSKIELGLELQRDADKRVVILTAKNTSDRPVLVDRELVLDFTINVEADGTECLKPVRNVSVLHWSETKWKPRMTVLRPGESLSRRLDLQSGVKNIGDADKPVPPGGEGVGEYIYRVCAPEKANTGSREAFLTVHCGIVRGRRAMDYYTNLTKQVWALPRLSGFRAINLATGETQSYEQYVGLAPAIANK